MNVYFCIFQLTFLRHCLKSVFIIVKWCSIFWILHHHHSSQSLPSRIKPFESVFAIVKWCSIFWILHHHSSQSLPTRIKPFEKCFCYCIVKWCSTFWILHHHSSQSLPSREKPFFPVNFPISNKYSPLRLPTVYKGCTVGWVDY